MGAQERVPGIPQGAPSPGRLEICLWHPVEQTAGIVPGWQRQPGSRNRTLWGVAKEQSQTGDTEMEPRDKILMARKEVLDATVEDPCSCPPLLLM